MTNFNLETIPVLLQYVNIILIPVGIYLIRIERRLTRIETILDIKKKERINELCGKNSC